MQDEIQENTDGWLGDGRPAWTLRFLEESLHMSAVGWDEYRTAETYFWQEMPAETEVCVGSACWSYISPWLIGVSDFSISLELN